MFDIGWSELLVIGIVALIAIGPKELPGVLRSVGQWMGKIRRMANDFQDQFREAMREAEVADLQKQVNEMTEAATSYTNFDPLADVKKDIEGLANDPLGTSAASAAPEAASPETAAATLPGPVSADAMIPQPEAAVAPAAPQAPQPKAGEGA